MAAGGLLRTGAVFGSVPGRSMAEELNIFGPTPVHSRVHVGLHSSTACLCGAVKVYGFVAPSLHNRQLHDCPTG